MKNKVYSFINIFGLAIGMACSLLIFLFVTSELGYDRFNKDSGDIYRIVKDFVNDDGSRLPDATTPPAIAPAMQRQIPEVVKVTRVFPNWGGSFLVTYKDKKIVEEKIYRVDSSFFDVFTFPFVEGQPASAFKDVNSVVLTRSAARRYFGNNEPMGKVLNVDEFGDMKVTGVIQDPPSNAHFHFDFLVSMRKFQQNIDESWGFYNFYTYAKVRPGTNEGDFTRKIQNVYKKGVTNGKNIFYVQPLNDIHLTSNLKWELEPNGDKLYVYVFTIIAIFIILIAGINYVNIATAKASARAREIGVRKVAGALRSSLIRQFLLESIVTCLIAAVFAVIIAQLLISPLNTLTAQQLSLTKNLKDVLYLFGGAIGLGAIAGFFPAVYLSSFRPVLVLKGLKLREAGTLNLRKALVVVQFTISIVLIIGALVISEQMHYVQSAKLGLNKEQVLVVKNAGYLSRSERNAFQNKALQLPGVKEIATSNGVIGGQNWTTMLNFRGSDNSQLVNFLSVGPDFLKILGMEVKEGRGFSAEYPADTLTNGIPRGAMDQTIGSIVLNETAVKDLGGKEAVGKQVLWSSDGDTSYYVNVVGVVKDFHFTSLRNEIKPFAFVVAPGRVGNFTVKLSTKEIAGTISQLGQKWKQSSTERPFEYNFLDETYNKLYQSEARFQKVFIILVVLGIFIACLGLFGLTTFAAQQRVKEIGIRKVLGASVGNIVGLLSKDFLQLVGIALLIASPIAWYYMHRWLQDFAYRIEINWSVFLLAAVIAGVIAFITISFQAVKAALNNPSKSLRTE